jgi:hypothetical protein
MQRLCNTHHDLLDCIGNAHEHLASGELTTFFPTQGALVPESHCELMVVGRSVNGWDDGWMAKEMLNPERRTEVARKVYERSITERMSWVMKASGPRRITGHKYNTKKSAFWRVIGLISQGFVGSGQDWPDKIIWSNLYKVSPAKGRNPSETLKRVQREICKKYLLEEVNLWRPQRILFLTGGDWAEPFVQHLSQELRWTPKTGPR